MLATIADKELEILISTVEKADVYLSCSWRPDAGQDTSWIVVRELDQATIRVVGDIADQPDQDDTRIKRIMQSCTGFVVILPYRNTSSTTSPYIIREIRIASELELPIAIFHETRVRVSLDSTNSGYNISFPSDTNETAIEIRHSDVFGPFEYDTELNQIQAQVAGKITALIDCVLSKPRKHQPYAFLATRLKDDFAQARNAIKTAVENETGLSCLWSDDKRHTTNIDGIRERTRLLIKHSTFVIADLSFTSDNPNNYNPSRSHEVGISIAYRKPIILCAQGTRRDPYFSASDVQMIFWNDEADLFMQISDWLRINKSTFSRRIYNRDLNERNSQYKSKIPNFDFVMNQNRRYIAPNYYEVSPIESWMTAIGFALIVFSSAQIIQQLGYNDTLDLVPIIASIFVLVFSSDISITIRNLLGRYPYLRIVVLITGLILLLVWAFLEVARPTTTS